MELDHYAIEPALSNVMVRAFAGLTSTALEKRPSLAIRECEGWARFVPGSFEQACVLIKLNAGSLTVSEGINEEESEKITHTLMREVLEIERYPEIVLCSSRISVSKVGNGQYWINLVGDLSLHGITATLPIAAQMALIGDTLRAHGEFTILHSSYKMKSVPVPGASFRTERGSEVFIRYSCPETAGSGETRKSHTRRGGFIRCVSPYQQRLSSF